MLASGEQARLPAPGSCDLCPSISSQAKIKGLDFSVADVGMTSLGLSAGWEAGRGVASFLGEDVEPACGQGDLPPWGGPALPSGKGLKPQESVAVSKGGIQAGASEEGLRGVGSAESQDSEPSPGPWGTARWASLSSLMSHGRGVLSDAAQGPPAPRSPARPRSPSSRPPQAPPPQADPDTCLSPAEKGCPGHAQVSALAEQQPALSTAGLWVLASSWAAGPCMIRRGRCQGLAEVLSRTSSVPRVLPWGAGLQGESLPQAWLLQRASQGGRLAAIDSHTCSALELCDCHLPRPVHRPVLVGRSLLPASRARAPSQSRQSPAERPCCQVSLPRAEIHPSAQ